MNRIDQVWLGQIACSVARWFNDRHEKWREIFTEAFICIPVVEFLLGEEWRLLAEMSNQDIIQDKRIPYAAYDIFAQKDNEYPLIIEFKLLKPIKRKGVFVANGSALNKGRIEVDVERLRNARVPCHRILVVAVHSGVNGGGALVKSLVKTSSDELSACDVSGNIKVWVFYLKPPPSAALSTT